MGLSCGIVGLPNVGKSTLFNALTQTAAADAQNYPFCTIEPNMGRVAVPDERLDHLARIAQSQNIIPNDLTFVDIAGLVRGASKGEGLGNQFLAHIRETDALIHVVRCFDGTEIIHVEGSVNPVRDIETIETELILADLESLIKRRPALEKKAKTQKTPELTAQNTVIGPLIDHLEQNKPVRSQMHVWDVLHQQAIKDLQLITLKPVLYVCNVSEAEVCQGNAYVTQVEAYASAQGATCVMISAQVESEIVRLDTAERSMYLDALGLAEAGLAKVIRQGYQLLGLLTFFTVGPKEARAWTAKKGVTAPQAAGVIHSDFERGFICAETMAYEDYVHYQGEQGCKNVGRFRQEGRQYIVQDGDVFHFRFNV